MKKQITRYFSRVATGAILLLAMAAFHSSFGQYYNQTPGFLNRNRIWVFGSKAGMAFGEKGPEAIKTSVAASARISAEGATAICHPSTGALLFYTNGDSVWNAQHTAMPNGHSLMGNSYLNAISTKQGTVIVPVIGDSSRYYLFSLTSQGMIQNLNGKKGSLFYSVVDMSLDNGSGDLIDSLKNKVVDSAALTEAMIAVPGCHNDIWLVVHNKDANKPQYKSYHITESGFDPVPILSDGLTATAPVNGMCVSPDRTKIALANALNTVSSEVAFFDPATGKISNPVRIRNIDHGYQSCAFSPDNTKLYFKSYKLLQYDVSVMDSATIDRSRDSLASFNYSGTIRLFNDTIYATTMQDSVNIARINQPNKKGLACDYQAQAITLLPGTSNRFAGLSTEIVDPFMPLLTKVIDTLLCSGWEQGISLGVSHFIDHITYTWNTGEEGDTIIVREPGTYWVRYRLDDCNTYLDSFVVKGSDLSTEITIKGFQLGTTGGPFVSYQWYLNGTAIEGANEAGYEVTANGDYTVVITDGYGCSFTSGVYQVTNYQTNIADLNVLGNMVRVYPNPSSDIMYISSPVPVHWMLSTIDGKALAYGSASVYLKQLSEGIYFLTICDKDGRRIKVEKIMKK